MRRMIGWLLAGIVSVTFTVLLFFPAAWIATIVEQQTAGRLTLGDAQGTLWRGSAFLGGAASRNDAITPLFPGRFSWHFSPLTLLGSVDIELENVAALSQPVKVTGGWTQWQISPATILLPAEYLVALGAPMNTVQPVGHLRLSWQPLQLARHNGKINMIGQMNLEMSDISSKLSPVRPLGSYDLTLDWQGQQATVTLKTLKGPMLLSGSGLVSDGHLQFSGQAESEAGQEERLGNFLNLLGQRRKQGDRDVIALEFK